MNDHLINCHLHDCIEIACLYRFRVALTLIDGSGIHGRAMTTRTGTDKREYLVISPSAQPDEQLVELARIKRMQALDTNPHFDTVEF